MVLTPRIKFMWCLSHTFFICALLSSFIASISIPTDKFPRLYTFQTPLHGAVVQNSRELSEVRFGIWGYCYYDTKNQLDDCERTDNVTITKGKVVAFVDWALVRKALISQPSATAFSTAIYLTYMLIIIIKFKECHDSHNSVYWYYFAYAVAISALFTALCFNIKFYSIINASKLPKLGITKTGPGLWFTIISFVLLLLWFGIMWDHNRLCELEKGIDVIEARGEEGTRLAMKARRKQKSIASSVTLVNPKDPKDIEDNLKYLQPVRPNGYEKPKCRNWTSYGD